MPRLPHGMIINPETVREADEAVNERIAQESLGFARVKPVDLRRFDFLFLDLQDDDKNLLPVSQQTRDALVKLGKEMADDGTDAPAGDTKTLSAAFTYFGQFVDHDITLDQNAQPGSTPPIQPDLEPLELEVIREETKNVRTGVLELDSVYGKPAPKDPQDTRKMLIGKVTDLGDKPIPLSRPPGKADENDLPREGRSTDIVHDRAARIGDPRNDENTIIAQLHLAFLLAHNRLVDEAAPPNRFQKAKRRLRRHYQYIVLHDFLKQIADPVIVDDTIKRNRVYDPDEDEFFMPLEFSVAAFRFGHSMVRAEYDFNANFNRGGPPSPPATLRFLFTFTALSGQLGEEIGVQQPDSDRLPENWIIEWEKFFDLQGRASLSKARKIDTQLVEPLQHLRTMKGEEEGEGDPERLAAKLAVRNLLRGYQMRMPTGQAVARALRKKLKGVRDIPVLTPEQLEKNAEKVNDEQAQVLKRELPGGTKFSKRTPLWYYILAEAAILRKGRRLGPVGSTIVAEVLVGLVRRSPDSILDPDLDWQPNLPSADQGRNLADLLRFARVFQSS
jgi:Animal haem peroxidase